MTAQNSPPQTGHSAAVIGGGIAGLTAAALLARNGVQTTLFERNAAVGGKMSLLEIDGFSWDMGPSLLTMPEILRETWALCGARLEDDLDLIPLPNTCRYHWADGTVIDEDREFWRRSDVARFLRYAEGLWQISEDAFLRNDITRWQSWFSSRTLGALRHFPKIASSRTLAESVRRFFDDRHVLQIFLRFATYNGSSPYKTPSAFNIIPYVQATFGGWYVRGGLHQISVKLRELAESRGAMIRTGTEVTALLPPATHSQQWLVRCSDGDSALFDGIICNQDVLTAHETLMPASFRDKFRETHLDVLELSTSGFVMFLGVRGTHPRLAHHNIFFSDDYPLEFTEMFDRRAPATDPTIYVAINAKSDPARAPANCENWFVLVNAPAASSAVDWSAISGPYGDAILKRLESKFGFDGLRERIVVRRDFTPADFQKTHLAYAGSLYGFASHGLMTAFQRPRITPRGLPRFHFAGGTTHPGGGVPLAMLSGRIAADKLLADLAPLLGLSRV